MGMNNPEDIASFRGAIRAMDRVVLDDLAQVADKAAKGTPKQHVSSRELSFELFDALFG